jgi:hypothetical protein
MKSFLQLCALLCLVSCMTGDAPLMAQKIKVWNGAPEEAGICRSSTNDLAVKLETVSFLLKQSHTGTTRKVCLSSTDESFKQYACLTFEDLKVLHDYIQTLIYTCKKW